MTFNLAAMVMRTTAPRRSVIPLPVIYPTKALQGELAGVYLRIVREWERLGREVIVPAYSSAMAELQRGGLRDAMRISDDLADIRNAQEGAGAAADRILIALTPFLRRWAERFEQWHRLKWTRNIFTATRVDLSTLIGPEAVRETLESVLGRNVALIRSVSDETRARIADIVFRGFQSRSPARDVAREIRDATGMARTRSLGIAIDQSNKLSALLDDERMREAGIDDWRWIHSGKKHFRPTHRARSGRIYNVNNQPADLPGMLPYCGCKKQAIIRLPSGRWSPGPDTP